MTEAIAPEIPPRLVLVDTDEPQLVAIATAYGPGVGPIEVRLDECRALQLIGTLTLALQRRAMARHRDRGGVDG